MTFIFQVLQAGVCRWSSWSSPETDNIVPESGTTETTHSSIQYINSDTHTIVGDSSPDLYISIWCETAAETATSDTRIVTDKHRNLHRKFMRSMMTPSNITVRSRCHSTGEHRLKAGSRHQYCYKILPPKLSRPLPLREPWLLRIPTKTLPDASGDTLLPTVI